MLSRKRLYTKVVQWTARNITQQYQVYILAVGVGLASGLAAVILKNTVHYTHYLLSDGFNYEEKNYLYFISPLLGILLTTLFVNFILKDHISHGVSRILYAISRNSSYLKPHHTYSSMIASTLTIAFGGSVGAEAPIVLTGSAIGSNLGRLMRQNYKNVTLMIGCGAAGAIAGIFKAPIAGLVFAIEVIMLDLTMMTVLPLLLSTVTASIVAYFFLGSAVEFTFYVNNPFELNRVPHYLILGIVCGGVALYFTRMSMVVERLFGKVKLLSVKAIIGGGLLGILIFAFPSLFGEGYDALMMVLNGQGDLVVNQTLFKDYSGTDVMFLVILMLIILFKVIAMAITNSAGGIGGVFAPALFVGGMTGFFTARLMNVTLDMNLPENNFALVGMAGIMAAVMHAPLTAIFLIAEITGGYQLLTPLMITASVSYITNHYFEPYSIYTKKLALKGDLITHHKDKSVLTRMKITDLIERNFTTVRIQETLGEFVQAIAKSERNIFPVVDEENRYLGVVFLNDIRHIIFQHDLYQKMTVRDLMFMPDVKVSPDDTMEDVASLFQTTSHYNIPVIDKDQYIGFVSRANVFSAYRKMLRDECED